MVCNGLSMEISFDTSRCRAFQDGRGVHSTGVRWAYSLLAADNKTMSRFCWIVDVDGCLGNIATNAF